MAFGCHDTQSQMYSSCNESISEQGKKAISILLFIFYLFVCYGNEMKIFLYWLLFTVGCIWGGREGICNLFFIFFHDNFKLSGTIKKMSDRAHS